MDRQISCPKRSTKSVAKKEILKKFFLKGQVVLEYALMVAVASAALVAMALYIRRGVQGKINDMEVQTIAKANKTAARPPVGAN